MKEIEIQKGDYRIFELNAKEQRVVIKNLCENLAIILICEETNKIAVCHAIEKNQIESIFSDIAPGFKIIKSKLLSLATHQLAVPMLTQQADFIDKTKNIENNSKHEASKREVLSIEWEILKGKNSLESFNIDMSGEIIEDII